MQLDQMKRREFITLLGGTAVAWPIAARAQQAAKISRVGILSPAGSEAAATLAAFRKGMRDLGYAEEQTIALVPPGEGKPRRPGGTG
jgi:putative tryptophan/tyrosine transport system substrate-binding protein